MIRHCSLWKFKDDAPATLFDDLESAFSTVADDIPSVRACQVGRNMGYLPTNLDFALTIDFDDLDGYRAYVVHDRHMQIFTTLLEPHFVSRESVQFELVG